MVTIKLGEADRARLGAPEVMRHDQNRMRLAEVRALAAGTGFTAEELAAGLNAGRLDAVAALVWLCLRRAGVDVPFDELDFEFGDLEMDVEDGQGNPPAPAGA